MGGLDRVTVDALTEFGRYYGLAFQVVDDILDIVATDEHLGKPSGNDLHEGIYTLPVIRALDSPCGPQLTELLGGAASDANVRSALQLVRASGGVEEALDEARHYVHQASGQLEFAGPHHGHRRPAGGHRPPHRTSPSPPRRPLTPGAAGTSPRSATPPDAEARPLHQRDQRLRRAVWEGGSPNRSKYSAENRPR